MHLDHGLYAEVLKQQIEEIKAAMSKREKFGYRLYCKAKGISLGTEKSGFPYLKTFQATRRGTFMWSKH